MKTGVQLIEQERNEQVAKHGWTRQHDIDQHPAGELVIQAAGLCLLHTHYHVATPDLDLFGLCKKFERGGERIHELKVAGALIAAEIDRLQAQ